MSVATEVIKHIVKQRNDAEGELAEVRRQRDLLLEAAKKVERTDGAAVYRGGMSEPLSHRLSLLYSAIRECEPPKSTREELEREVVEQVRQMVKGGGVPRWDQFTQLEELIDELDALA